jgi:hypothetical protein
MYDIQLLTFESSKPILDSLHGATGAAGGGPPSRKEGKLVGKLGSGLIDIVVTYGIGASCRARFDMVKLEGKSAREIIEEVVHCPRPPGDEARTAKVLAEVLREGRPLDVELVNGPSDGGADGRPITLDHVLVPRGDTTSRTLHDRECTTLQVSESFRGGSSWGFSTCE